MAFILEDTPWILFALRAWQPRRPEGRTRTRLPIWVSRWPIWRFWACVATRIRGCGRDCPCSPPPPVRQRIKGWLVKGEEGF